MHMNRAFIIDDELQSRNILKTMLHQHFPDLLLLGQASSVEEGLTGIRQHQPNLVFLDIQMQGESGFDLLNKLDRIDFALIFTTAFDHYAIKAFRFNAIDYLLKPIVAAELVDAVNKVKGREAPLKSASKMQVDQLYQDIKNPQKTPDKLAIPTLEGFIFLSVHDILYCRASNNYTEFHLLSGKIVISSHTLKQYDEMLSNQSFFRANRSYLINLSHIKLYRKGDGGEIVMSNGHEIELSRSHKEELLVMLNIRS